MHVNSLLLVKNLSLAVLFVRISLFRKFYFTGVLPGSRNLYRGLKLIDYKI